MERTPGRPLACGWYGAGGLRTPAASAEAGKSAGYMTKNQFKAQKLGTFYAKMKSEAQNEPRIGPKMEFKPAATLILHQKPF